MKNRFLALLVAGALGIVALHVQANSNIKERGGVFYLSKNATVQDVAEFYWRSLDGWSENPEQVAKYFTPRGRFELPYAPVDDFPMFSTVNEGREAITGYFTGLSQTLGNLRYSDWRGWKQYATSEPGLYLFEYTSSGVIRATGGEYHQQFIATVKIKNGQIAVAHEYWNPYVVLRDLNLIRKVN
ncbi:TPA: nuclear transport factor 2 family protein [Pseudomonas aeruginosa]|nr:nuclear transport factor 2 family protein [Pseudomonas aeruginosa]HEP8841272.1 nuclear transport factor 2 family protein [Pseudomonas aeruginosa]HEP8853870.1 nuclear transport factor 2 family protein [Pseudomonas aeruginosa]